MVKSVRVFRSSGKRPYDESAFKEDIQLDIRTDIIII